MFGDIEIEYILDGEKFQYAVDPVLFYAMMDDWDNWRKRIVSFRLGRYQHNKLNTTFYWNDPAVDGKPVVHQIKDLEDFTWESTQIHDRNKEFYSRLYQTNISFEIENKRIVEMLQKDKNSIKINMFADFSVTTIRNATSRNALMLSFSGGHNTFPFNIEFNRRNDFLTDVSIKTLYPITFSIV